MYYLHSFFFLEESTLKPWMYFIIDLVLLNLDLWDWNHWMLLRSKCKLKVTRTLAGLPGRLQIVTSPVIFMLSVLGLAEQTLMPLPSSRPGWMGSWRSQLHTHHSLLSLFPVGPHPLLSRPYYSLHTQLTFHFHRKGTDSVCIPWLNSTSTKHG